MAQKFVVSGKERLHHELQFSNHLASGPGGQNVQKTATAVLLKFNLVESQSFTAREKDRLLLKLGSRLTNEGELIVKAQTQRSLLANKDEVVVKLIEILEQALYIQPPRKATKPTRSSQRRRVDDKKKKGQNKKLRQNKNYD